MMVKLAAYMYPSKPAYGVYISQLVRIGRICSNFVQFKLRHYTLTQKLMKQGFGTQECVWHSGSLQDHM